MVVDDDGREILKVPVKTWTVRAAMGAALQQLIGIGLRCYGRTDGFGLIILSPTVLSPNVLPVVLLTKCSRPQPGHVTAS